jgi:hypothetical protein
MAPSTMVMRFLLRMVAKVVRRPVMRHLRAFEEATRRPREVQEAVRRRILTRHADTAFGRDHGFRHLRTVEDFRRQLPVAGYEYFEPYIARVRRGETAALLADDDPLLMFALTSGTTSARKFIPVTQQYLDDYRRTWSIWGLKAYWDHPQAKLRPIVQLSSDWDEFRTEADVPCGSVTGLTALVQKRIVRFLYCVPACVARIKDPIAKYYVVLRLSLPKPAVMIIAANPSTVVNLARAGDQLKESLIRDLADGTLSPQVDVPAEVRAALEGRLRRRHRQRAQELEAIVRQTGTLHPRDYWRPEHSILGNWTGGSVGAYLRHFPRYFGATPVRDVGLIASEGRMTIPVADGTPSGVLDITSHYFEFIPEGEADRPNPTVLAAHELKEGGQYFILPTTAYGLYRYDIHDLVRVTGFFNGTPLVEFLSKGSHFANITGEKLSEYHVTGAMQSVLRDLSLSLTAYTLAPCWDDDQPYYGLFVERGDFTTVGQGTQLVEALDRELGRCNIEYANKRESLRLGPVRLEWLPAGTWHRWDRQRLVRSGGTADQYKHPCLIPDPHFRTTMPVEAASGAADSRLSALSGS